MTHAPSTIEVAGAGGTPLRVLAEGRGPPVLLVHGGSNGPQDWERVAQRLADRCRLLRYTRFTYRHDPPPASASAMMGEVHDVLAIAAAVGEPIVAVGHSSGGIVVLESALADPTRFAGILLYEPPVAVAEPLGGEALRRARAALDAGDEDRAVGIFFREIVGVPRLVVRCLELVPPLWRRMREYAPAQITDAEAIESLGVGLGRYSELAVPALLLQGGLLSPAPARHGVQALERVLPRVVASVKLRIAGHGAYYSAPRKVARIIADFAERMDGES